MANFWFQSTSLNILVERGRTLTIVVRVQIQIHFFKIPSQSYCSSACGRSLVGAEVPSRTLKNRRWRVASCPACSPTHRLAFNQRFDSFCPSPICRPAPRWVLFAARSSYIEHCSKLNLFEIRLGGLAFARCFSGIYPFTCPSWPRARRPSCPFCSLNHF